MGISDTFLILNMRDTNKVETIIVVMFENRSFDHLMGYLGFPPYNREIEGLQKATEFTNSYNGFQYAPFHLGDPDKKLPDDPPHDRNDIGIQIDPGGKG